MSSVWPDSASTPTWRAWPFPLAYPWFFRRNVLGSSAAFERQWLHFTKLTWLHDGHGKAGLLIKNSAHSARVELVLRHFPRARFVMLRRDPQASIRSLVQVKQRLGSLVGLQPCPMPSPRWRKRWKPIASCLGPLRYLGIGFLWGSWLNCPMRH